MKVVTASGFAFTRDHPHEIISPNVMRFEEIREWLRTLSTDPAYGWFPGGIHGLQRSLGMNSKYAIKSKLTRTWIWPREQVRLTARINDILDGYIVPTRFPNKRVEGVYTDPPRPPVINRPRVIHGQATVAGLTLSAHRIKPPPRLPEFRDAFVNVPTWQLSEKSRRP
jgi:hypothetical protein